MKQRIILASYYIEAMCSRLLRMFGVRRNVSAIPDGQYCYIIDKERNEKEPIKNGGYWIKPCRYYRGTKKTGGVACIYVGFYGFDFCLYDQCKICGVNDEIDE